MGEGEGVSCEVVMGEGEGEGVSSEVVMERGRVSVVRW